MSTEKVTTERALALRDILESHGWTDAQAEEAWAEFDRSRRSEAEKDANLTEQEAVIKSLADALADAKSEIGAIADHKQNPVNTKSALFQLCERIDAVLRRAGRFS